MAANNEEYRRQRRRQERAPSDQESFTCRNYDIVYSSGSSVDSPSFVKHPFLRCSCNHIIFQFLGDFIHFVPNFRDPHLNMDNFKLQVACLYFINNNRDDRKRTPRTGYLPIIQLREYCEGEDIESLDTLKDYVGAKRCLHVKVECWVQPKRLLVHYIECCNDINEPQNLKLLMKLFNLRVDDFIDVSRCDLDDLSVVPFINALRLRKYFSVINISHNNLGTHTLEYLKENLFMSSSKYGPLTLDLHCNRFGLASLNEICESPWLLSHLEVLNISYNRLACASHLSKILLNCKVLYKLFIESCSLTPQIIETLADSIHSGSSLEQLFIGYNRSLSGYAIAKFLDKLVILKRFTHLSLSGLALNKDVIDSLCKLITEKSLGTLLLGDTCIGTEWAIQLGDSLNARRRSLLKLDLSGCVLTSDYIRKITSDSSFILRVCELNLAGNPLNQEGGIALSELFKRPDCRVRVVDLSRCSLGLLGLLAVVEAVANKDIMHKVSLSDNMFKDDDLNEKFTCVQRLSTAISKATRLRVLDLSLNGFDEESGKTLYKAWSRKSRFGDSLTRSDIHGSIFHLSVEPDQCCNTTESCCQSLY